MPAAIARRALAGLCLVALAGCASGSGQSGRDVGLRPSGGQSSSKPAEPDSLDEEKSGRAVYADVIRALIAQEQYYAALAHIQQQQREGGNNDELRFLEAEARRSLGQAAEAEKLYRQLLRSRYAAQSYRGLGLLYAPRDLNASVQYLREAVQRQPTSAEMRNDLGYALMSGGRYREALTEFATAVELEPGQNKARNNLIVLLILSRDEAGVKRVAAAGGVDDKSLASLRRQAQNLSSRVATSQGVK
ncbi:tetratricopeptide repeat protein [Solimonas sp. SE-A11]|uniref:tetratricopeptide repeat protein n=1 Tax=Solimonas sp. SE-A11 TaxID=3054954 RepID=UPI00259C6968|nr:tetratricopeptide repeat protein [Solimonas sp. SE-A11]MDM4772434.1 hypothetical protein [Solimonas sp. SE-A11]